MEQQNVLEQILEGSMKPTHLPLETLRKITEDFSVDRIIGEGGFGTVYKGVIGNFNVAVKRIRSSMTINQKLFRREVDNQMDVNHENVVRFLGLCSHTVETPMKDPESQGYIYVELRERLLCFEYVSNGSLDKYITDELRGLEWDTRYQIIRGICAGLQYLHVEKRILHMDLKPANILLDNQMMPKITDFGLSRPVENAQTMTTNNFATLGYGAPENIFGHGIMSVKSDMYSLGAIITELITGRKGVPDNSNNILRRWRHRWNKSVKETPLEYHQQVTECVQIGSLCLNFDPYARPSISQIMRKFVEMESTEISPLYWEDDMLGVEPLELQFRYHRKKQILSCSVELSNDMDSFFAFKIQTTSPLPYSIEPNSDIVKPRSKCSVNITLPADNTHDHRAATQYSTSNKQYTEEFIVRSIKLNEGLTAKDIKEDMFDKHTSGHHQDEIHLVVVSGSPTTTDVDEDLFDEHTSCHHADEIHLVGLSESPTTTDVDEDLFDEHTSGHHADEILLVVVSETPTTKDVDEDIVDEHTVGHHVDQIQLTVVSEEPCSEEVVDCPNMQVQKPYASSDDSSVQSGTTQVNVNDEDPITAASDSGSKPTQIKSGSVQLVIENNKKAPLLESRQKVLLELTGGDYASDRPGLDLVVVLDVGASGQMYIEKLAELKIAMRFIMQKLSPIDRLSVVTFSYTATKLYPLRQMTRTSKQELQGLIDSLEVFGGSSNIKDGLLTGLKVLADRKVTGGRIVGIMLMSDGKQKGDASQVTVGNVPVFTFCFGMVEDPKMLSAIAAKSMGGTFSHINDTGGSGLTTAFSQCLAGLLTVSVRDLELTVAAVGDNSRILMVTAGSYPQTQDGDSVTVCFSNVYSREVRKVIVDLLLPAIQSERTVELLKVTYSYKGSSSSSGRLQFLAPPERLTMWRTGMEVSGEMLPELQMEEARLQTAKMIKEVVGSLSRWYVEPNEQQSAHEKLVNAHSMMDNVLERPQLRTELQELIKLFETRQICQDHGRYYACSWVSSHDWQRFAARGDMEATRPFATPRMHKYMEQAKKFHHDPRMQLPSPDDDGREEVDDLGDVASREEEMQRLSLEMEG